MNNLIPVAPPCQGRLDQIKVLAIPRIPHNLILNPVLGGEESDSENLQKG
jgi:hypothetical protein